MSEKNLQNWETEIRRGVIQLLVLAVLSEGKMHGIAICNRIFQMTQGIIEVPLGTVYPLLRRFINENLIESFKQKGQDQRRTIYKINSQGLEYYAKIQDKWLRYATTVSNFLHKKEG